MKLQTSTMSDAAFTAKMLSEALPYLQRYSGAVVVVKFGGNAMGDDAAMAEFARDIVLMRQVGVNPVVVHGGGPMINEMLEKLGIKSTFVRGKRVTDKATVQVVEMILSGLVNKRIVQAIMDAGGRAVGISGKDDDLSPIEPLDVDAWVDELRRKRYAPGKGRAATRKSPATRSYSAGTVLGYYRVLHAILTAAAAKLRIANPCDGVETPTGGGRRDNYLSAEEAVYEAGRCLSCGNCFECDNCYGVCPDNAVIKLGPDKGFEFNYDYCKGCGICAAECPCGAIEMVLEES